MHHRALGIITAYSGAYSILLHSVGATILTELAAACVTLKLKKCTFFSATVKYLGHIKGFTQPEFRISLRGMSLTKNRRNRDCDFLSKPELPLINPNSPRTPRVSSAELYVCIKAFSVCGRIATCRRYTVLSIIMIRKQYDNSPVSMRNPRTYFSYLCKEICKNRTRVLNFNTYHAKRYEIPVA